MRADSQLLSCPKSGKVLKTLIIFFADQFGQIHVLMKKNRRLIKGAMKRGRGMCGMSQSYKLTYLHILRAGMVYITMVCAHTDTCM